MVTMLPNSPELIFLWLALSRLQAVIIPVNSNYKALALRHIVDDSGARCIVFPHKITEDVNHAVSIFEDVNLLISLGGHIEGQTIAFEDYLEKPIFGGPFNPDRHDDMVMFYSGATTGPAKSSIFSNYRIAQNTDQFLSAIHYKDDTVVMIQFSMCRPMGFVAGFNAAVMSGASLALVDERDRENISVTAKKSNPAVFIGESAFYDRAYKSMTDEEFPKSIVYCIAGGGRLKREIQENFYSRFKLNIYKVYGLIEAGPILTVNTDRGKYVSIGIPVGKINVVVMRNEKMINDDRIGEICIPSFALNDHVASQVKDNIVNGWYHTGDLGCFDMDGYLYFVDRKAYLINVNGFEVYPEQIEMALAQHGDVKEVVVNGVPKGSHSEEIHAHIISKDNKRLSEYELKEFLKDKLPAYQIPEKFLFVNHFPRSATGKIVRQALK